MTKDTRNNHPSRIGPGRHYAILKRKQPNPVPRNVAIVVFFGILIGVLIGLGLGIAVAHLAGIVEAFN